MRLLLAPAGAALLAAILLAGCGPDRPANTRTSTWTQPPPIPPNGAGAVDDDGRDAAPAAKPDADPLAASAADAAPVRDPLAGERDGPPADPLAGGDPLKGPKMPTQHSHWLSGQVRDAQVAVSLNGVRVGEFSGLVDRDVTMRLRPGVNTVSFTYRPDSAQASARLNLLESEHHPPIPPLATFQSVAPPDAGPKPAAPQTKTLTFTAR